MGAEQALRCRLEEQVDHLETGKLLLRRYLSLLCIILAISLTWTPLLLRLQEQLLEREHERKIRHKQRGLGRVEGEGRSLLDLPETEEKSSLLMTMTIEPHSHAIY